MQAPPFPGPPPQNSLLIQVPRRELRRRTFRLGLRDGSVPATRPVGHGLEGGGRSAGTADGELLAVGAADHGARGGASAAAA